MCITHSDQGWWLKLQQWNSGGEKEKIIMIKTPCLGHSDQGGKRMRRFPPRSYTWDGWDCWNDDIIMTTITATMAITVTKIFTDLIPKLCEIVLTITIATATKKSTMKSISEKQGVKMETYAWPSLAQTTTVLQQKTIINTITLKMTTKVDFKTQAWPLAARRDPRGRKSPTQSGFSIGDLFLDF